MTNVNWDDFSDGSFIKFENIGDGVKGTIVGVRPSTDFNGNPCPALDLATEDGDKTLTCGQANLKAQIVGLKPNVGDTIEVRFTHTEKAALGTKKMFTITHVPGSLGTPVADTEPPF
jgi:hypothetical protein